MARPFAFSFTDPRNSGVVSIFVRNFVVSADGGLDEDDGGTIATGDATGDSFLY